MTVSAYGSIVVGSQVEAAVLATLRLWMPHYLAEIARQLAMPQAPPNPRSYRVWSDQTRWPEDQTPAVIVVSPGLASSDPLTRRASAGAYTATWVVSAGCVVSASDQTHTRRLSGIYAAALRAALVQHPSLDGVALATVWTGESYVHEAASGRTTALGIADFEVQIADVVDPQAGPLTPPATPGTLPTWPQLVEFDGQVIHQEDTP